jgi:hypothetical protein
MKDGICGEKKDEDDLMQPGMSKEDLTHATAAASIHRSMPFSRRSSPCRRHRTLPSPISRLEARDLGAVEIEMT